VRQAAQGHCANDFDWGGPFAHSAFRMMMSSSA
jgi:hypothetical protein